MKNLVQMFSLAILAMAFLFNVVNAADKTKTDINTSTFSSVITNSTETNINESEGIQDSELENATKTLKEESEVVNIDTEKIRKAIENLNTETEVKTEVRKTPSTEE